jgi:hypothetical protein
MRRKGRLRAIAAAYNDLDAGDGADADYLGL